jgi:hypothetical protein
MSNQASSSRQRASVVRQQQQTPCYDFYKTYERIYNEYEGLPEKPLQSGFVSSTSSNFFDKYWYKAQTMYAPREPTGPVQDNEITDSQEVKDAQAMKEFKAMCRGDP